jgi:hypothetical protein
MQSSVSFWREKLVFSNQKFEEANLTKGFSFFSCPIKQKDPMGIFGVLMTGQ